MSGFIFHDPSGRRGRRAGIAAVAAAMGVVGVLVAFVMTLALAPYIPQMSFRDPRVYTALHAARVAKAARKSPPVWTRVPRPGHKLGQGEKPLNVAFYVSWDETARQSLAANIDKIDIVAPQWIALANAHGDITVTNDGKADAIIARAARRPSVMPVIFNARDKLWDGKQADDLLNDPVARKALVQHLVDFASKRGYSGYILDLENLSPRGLKAYPSFIAELNRAMDPTGREVWATAPFDDADWPLRAMADAGDSLVLMAYDEHYWTGDPGPAASQGWFDQHLARTMKGLDPNKVVVALGAFGYDWTKGAKGADAVTFHEATLAAKESGVTIAFDHMSLNPTYGYADEAGKEHTVWFLDAATAYNEVKVADAWRPRGYGLWRLGAEDPGVWSVLGRPYHQVPSITALGTIPAGGDVDYNGSGEILNPTGTPTPGKRALSLDPATGLISAERYDAIPGAWTLQRLGAHPGKVALTFDDGPDPTWTPRVLDILKEKQAAATFFVIGENMEMWPDIVKREVDQGLIVGSHTYTHPNIGTVSPDRVKLELNLTQRLFQVITGRTLRFFRPPYLGDASPSTPREVQPLMEAKSLGYLSVGLRIDPDDWKRPDADLIVQRTLERLADTNPDTGGQMVLLHDSGGDRSQTLKALPLLIDQLRAHGYQLVTVADLGGLTPAQAMPASTAEPGQIMLDRVAFDMVRSFNKSLTALFVTAIALGMGRLFFLAVLAIAHRLQVKARTPQEPPIDFDGPLVSVLIPCFNEEAVIVSSVRRILASNWRNIEVLVLDDGSKDATSARVKEAFGDHSRVRLMRFENGGKARALNRGLAEAKGEIVVALDADTQFPPETIGRLTRWFGNPRIGAVAGNALVGNRVNLITRWQALEYVTAQNLERRALSALGVITVVPGAVGAWRRAAIEAIGGFPDDTLAEDQDLTLAVQRAGWLVEFDPEARAYTEAPDTVGGLLKQRFRWSFGTLQCVWKHRGGVFNPKNPILGFIALPQVWMFQIALALVAPLVDLAVIYSLIVALIDRIQHPDQWNDQLMNRTLIYWGLFVAVDLLASALGMAMEKRAPWGDLFWLPVQRFGYRQLIYYVVVKAVITAVRGPYVGWGKLERKASVDMDAGARSSASAARMGKAKPA